MFRAIELSGRVLLATMLTSFAAVSDDTALASDNFENGLSRWESTIPKQIEIIVEPGGANHVMQLTPKRREFVHAILILRLHGRRFAGGGLFVDLLRP